MKRPQLLLFSEFRRAEAPDDLRLQEEEADPLSASCSRNSLAKRVVRE